MADEAYSAAQVSELPRFNVAEYRPDGGFGMSGVMMLVSAMAIAGAAGYAVHLVSQAFYLILLFPILVGFVMGYVGKKMVASGRVRSPLIGGLAGFVGGVFAMTMMHYFDYQKFKGALDKHPELRELAQMSPEQRKEVIREDLNAQERAELDEALEYASVKNLAEYMDKEARHGVELKRAASGGKGMNLGYYGSYIYWGIEILIVAAITFGSVKAATAEPFCVACNEWKKPRVLGFFSAGTAADSATALRSGNLNSFRASAPTPEATNLRLTSYMCPDCAGTGEVDVKVEFLTADNKGNITGKTQAFSRYPAAAMPPMEGLFAPAPPVVAAPDAPAAPPTA